MKHERFHPSTAVSWAGGYQLRSNYFLGSEIKSRTIWGRNLTGNSTNEYTARMRLGTFNPANFRTGLVAGFFTYGADPYAKDDELDIELLGNRLYLNYTPKQIWTNTWNDATPNGAFSNVPGGLDLSTWQTYRIRWRPDRIEWHILVNGVWTAIRPAVFSPLPDEAMRIHFNIWAPHNSPTEYDARYDPSFGRWYDGKDLTYIPTGSTLPADQATHYIDIDWVKIEKVLVTGAMPSASAIDTEETQYSSVTLSSHEAEVQSQTIQLHFTGPLDPKTVDDLSHYLITANGGEIHIESATYKSSTNTIVLQMRPDSFERGDRIRAACSFLKDAKGLELEQQLSDAALAQ